MKFNGNQAVDVLAERPQHGYFCGQVMLFQRIIPHRGDYMPAIEDITRTLRTGAPMDR